MEEAANTIDAPLGDDPPFARFTWVIENFSRLNDKELYSDPFFAGGYKWRVLIFPNGNNTDHLSLYIEPADSQMLRYGFSIDAKFSLAVVNQVHRPFSFRKDTQHKFYSWKKYNGFTSFMPLSELHDDSRGYLINDTCIVESEVTLCIDYLARRSKMETGYIGFKNHGATCHLNSILQTFYHIPYFRKAVLRIPIAENERPTKSISLDTKVIFIMLMHSQISVTTEVLTKSLRLDTYVSFKQHDVQELSRDFCEILEEKMKGTVVEGAIKWLFEGHYMNYVECINVDSETTIKGTFSGLQLDVKGCRNVYDSFDKYVEVERLEGDINRYHAEPNWLQCAKKAVLFIDFPPVLQLQLERFEYDFMRDIGVKINDRYKFPLQLDLDREDGKYLAPHADRSVRNLYTLHSVIVHSGGVHDGHYYVYIRPTLSDQWFKFDDERVTKEDTKTVLYEQYGGEELHQANLGVNNSTSRYTKHSNACMLVYILESEKAKILCNDSN